MPDNCLCRKVIGTGVVKTFNELVPSFEAKPLNGPLYDSDVGKDDPSIDLCSWGKVL